METKTIAGVMTALCGVAGAYALGAHRAQPEPEGARGRVFWVAGEQARSGEETVVVDERAMQVLWRVLGPLAKRADGYGYELASVAVAVGKRGNDEPDAFGASSYVIEPLGPRQERERVLQQHLTSYFRDLILLNVLDEGGWFTAWPRRLLAGGFSQQPTMRIKRPV